MIGKLLNLLKHLFQRKDTEQINVYPVPKGTTVEAQPEILVKPVITAWNHPSNLN